MRRELNDAFDTILRMEPAAYASLLGSEAYPDVHGSVYFYPFWDGSLVIAEAAGLPFSDQVCGSRIFGFHIHQGSLCEDGGPEPFSSAGSHYDRGRCPHPFHSGDLPPLFGNNGYALCMFYTGRFTPEEAVGHTVIIHDGPDDFTSQPAGNSGTRMACGEIRDREV